MITLEEAKRLIAHSSKLNHSLFVSSLMGRLAGFLDSDLDTWMLVGLLHDLDYDETVCDRSKHGVIAANRLSGMLPEEALLAIQRHDHRTGMLPETDLDYALNAGLAERPLSDDQGPVAVLQGSRDNLGG